MTREEAKELLPIIQAFAEGKTVEVKCAESWVKIVDDDIDFSHSAIFRIKPEPRYRPFKDADECWEEMKNHQPFGWVKEKGDEPSYELLAHISENDEAPISFAVYGSVGMGIIDRPSIEFNGMFNTFTFADGAPFGVKVG